MIYCNSDVGNAGERGRAIALLAKMDSIVTITVLVCVIYFKVESY